MRGRKSSAPAELTRKEIGRPRRAYAAPRITRISLETDRVLELCMSASGISAHMGGCPPSIPPTCE